MPDDDIDPAMAAILTQLWRAHAESPGRAWSLAKLSKQAGVPMSGLRRQLTVLVESGLVDTTFSEEGLGTACLSETGVAVCEDLFADALGEDTPKYGEAPDDGEATPPPRLH
jgi:hypothetical protein